MYRALIENGASISVDVAHEHLLWGHIGMPVTMVAPMMVSVLTVRIRATVVTAMSAMMDVVEGNIVHDCGWSLRAVRELITVHMRMEGCVMTRASPNG